MTPKTPAWGWPPDSDDTTEAAPPDVLMSVSPPLWCHTWATIATGPPTPDWEVCSTPWYDVSWPATAALPSRLMANACWLAATSLSTVTGAPDVRWTAATELRTAASVPVGALGSGPTVESPLSAVTAMASVPARACSCPRIARAASTPGMVTVTAALTRSPGRHLTA